MRGPHDVGGLSDGAVETEAHAMTMWEKEIDALRGVVGQKGIVGLDEHRRYVEQLGQDAYDRMTYHERWTAALTRELIDKGVLTQVEIDARVALVRERLAQNGDLDLAMEAAGQVPSPAAATSGKPS